MSLAVWMTAVAETANLAAGGNRCTAAETMLGMPVSNGVESNRCVTLW